MSGCGTCFGSLFPPLAALTFAASSIICAFGLAAAAPRSQYRHLELCGIALITKRMIKRSKNNSKKISYGSLNGALVSDQDKDKFETCFVFNSEQMDSFASGKQRSRSNIIRMLERWMN